LAFPMVGALIASRRPHNPIGWILLADGFLWILSGMFDYYSIYGAARLGPLPCGDRRTKQLAVDTCRGAAGHLSGPAVPGWEAPL
jgi:hypothetical protein